MKRIIDIRTLFFIFILCFSFSLPVKSETFEAWKETFAKQAIKEGIDAAFLEEILPQMHLLHSVVKSDRKQPVSGFQQLRKREKSEDDLRLSFRYASDIQSERRLFAAGKLRDQHLYHTGAVWSRGGCGSIEQLP